MTDNPQAHRPLRLLLVEDEEADALLLTRHLRRGGYDPQVTRVDNEDALRQALAAQSYDLVLSDYSMPGFDGLKALLALRETGADTPFMVVSGSIGEDTAVRLMREGASDYIMKDNLTRLIPAVERELREARLREERRQMAQSLQLVQRLTSAMTGQTFLQALVAQLGPGLGASRVYVARCVGEETARLLAHWPGDGAPLAQDFALAAPVAAALKTGAPLWLPQGVEDLPVAPLPFGGPPPGSLLALPFVEEDDALYGWLGVEHAAPTLPGHLDLSSLSILAARAGAEILRLRAEEARRRSEERYALAVRAANDGLWDWDLLTEKVYYSQRWKELMGQTAGGVSEHINEWLGRVHPEERDALREELTAHLNGLTSHFEMEHRMLHRDGSYRWILTRGLAVRGEEGQATRMAGSATDVTQRKKAEQQIVRDAFHDSLTTLPNRALFLERLGQTLRHAARQKNHRLSVMVVNLDRFKLVNDSLGHLRGDQLLIAAAQRLERVLPADVTLARLGGDEFAVLLERVKNDREALVVAQLLVASLKEPFNLGDHEVRLTASVGVALGEGAARAEALLREADTAMWHAKAQGKDRSALFTPDMHTQAMARFVLDGDLRRGLGRGELALYYQPVYELASGRVAGFEALVRWHHPTQGLLMPGQFIPLAEETGLILDVGREVLRLASAEFARLRQVWRGAGEATVAVNLSAPQFSQPGLVEEVRQALTQAGLPPQHLRLEITESVLMENAFAAAAVLGELKTLGVRASLDDFGTGYSSLSYLHHLPLDTLKMDRAFVSPLEDVCDPAPITHAILNLGRSLNLRVVAEGIETQTQLDRLRQSGCPHGQGFYLAEPKPMSHWLAKFAPPQEGDEEATPAG